MPDFNFNSQFLDTVGLEAESIFLNKEIVQNVLTERLDSIFPNRRVLTVGRDASAEIMIESIRIGTGGYLNFSSHTKAFSILSGAGRNPVTIGYEFWTNPLSIRDMEKLIFPTMFTLVGMGDSVSERAASHIHVGFAHNLRLMKRLLRICLAIDPVLFRLGGMGGIFRGWKNNAAYARPLMNSVAVRISKQPTQNTPSFTLVIDQDGIARRRRVPVVQEQEVVSTNSPYVRIINPMEALQAKDTAEFWASFGVSEGNMTKYHPSRYTGINFYAILAHGTIEFRHLNASLDPQLVLAIIKFLRAMVEVSTICNKEEIMSFEILPSNEQISVGDAMEIITKIINLCRKHDVENLPTAHEMDIIVSTLELSTFISVPEIPVLSHVQDFFLSPKISLAGKLESVEEVLEANQVDIHNIRNKESSIFDSFPEAL